MIGIGIENGTRGRRNIREGLGPGPAPDPNPKPSTHCPVPTAASGDPGNGLGVVTYFQERFKLLRKSLLIANGMHLGLHLLKCNYVFKLPFPPYPSKNVLI